VTNIFEKEPRPMLALAPRRPAAMVRLVERLLAKRPEERYQSASDLISALSSIGNPPKPWSRVFRRSN